MGRGGGGKGEWETVCQLRVMDIGRRVYVGYYADRGGFTRVWKPVEPCHVSRAAVMSAADLAGYCCLALLGFTSSGSRTGSVSV